MWWSPNTIKPNPLSSLIFLKRHHLTLFPYYHPAKIQNFPILLPPKKKKKIPSSHQHPSLYVISQNKKQKKVELLYAKCVSSFGCRETWGITWFQFFFFSFFFLNFGFCIEFLIELLKKIEALLFFEIELVCGIRLYFWVLFDFWKDWISGRIFAYMLVFWGHLDRFRWL